MFGALADGTSLSASEIDSFDAEKLIFWWDCIMEWRRYAANLES
ncbi:hypothetical protein GGQ67_001107 [Rhizobium metallidurans]|uniref:Uncharacterized protein n=1 Tax=Rhizobium metallidurans TaxID=1265931 RepID=A0A7W6CLU1_9HYPH|nr:hypothetical protein [Rhizobium metallidurans]